MGAHVKLRYLRTVIKLRFLPFVNLTQINSARTANLTQLNAVGSRKSNVQGATFREVPMPDLSTPATDRADMAMTDISTRLELSNKLLLDSMVGVQRMVLEEIVFTGNEFLDRLRTETHLLTEFVSKLAGAHSVKGIQSMLEECGQHQLDFARRDCDRIFRHGRRAMDAGFAIINLRWQN
jgi:hypothetical protein